MIIYIVTEIYSWLSIANLKGRGEYWHELGEVVGITNSLNEAMPIAHKHNMGDYSSTTIYRKELKGLELDYLNSEDWRKCSLNAVFEDGSRLTIKDVGLDNTAGACITWKLVDKQF